MFNLDIESIFHCIALHLIIAALSQEEQFLLFEKCHVSLYVILARLIKMKFEVIKGNKRLMF